MIFSTADLLPKTTRNTIGVAVMSLKKKAVLQNALSLEQSGIENQARYRMKTIPALALSVVQNAVSVIPPLFAHKKRSFP